MRVRGVAAVVACGLWLSLASGLRAQRSGAVVEVANGHWLGPDGFVRGTRYIVAGRLTARRPSHVDTTLDLAGMFVVPPFGEAHNHNVDFTSPVRTDSVIRQYLRDGVFYVKNPAILPRNRALLAGRINVPNGVDAVFSNGVLTATDGHPIGLYRRNLGRHVMREEDGEGAFFWTIDSATALAAKWPKILAGRPDFIKVILVHSEEHAARRADSVWFNWKGLDPALLPEVVRRAHAAGLRVSAHIETAADFRAAVASGVDEINHLPGYRGNERLQFPDPAMFTLSDVDAALAAQHGVIVVTTAGGFAVVSPSGPDSALRRQADSLQAGNLRRLRRAGVILAVGSDDYRDDSSNEVRYLERLGMFDAMALLRLWSEATPKAIFPKRRVGCLEDGCEASFLVLGSDPRRDFAAVRDIRLRVKDGAAMTP